MNMTIESSSDRLTVTTTLSLVNDPELIIPNGFVTSRIHQFHSLTHPDESSPLDPLLQEWERAHIHFS